MDGLHPIAQEIFTTFAAAYNVPVEFVIGAGMAAVAQAAGDTFRWSNGKFEDYLQFYIALVADSTATKTATLNKLFEPIVEADKELMKRWEEAEALGESKGKMPKTHYMDDYTIEVYQRLLQANTGGVTIFADEILSFFGNMNRYRPNGADEKFYLTTFGSYKPYKVVRMGRIDNIPHPITRIIGGIQPDVLSSYFGGSQMLSDGLLPRFLWFLFPSDFVFSESADDVDISQVKAKWHTIINNILCQQDHVEIVFSDEAKRLYGDFKKQHIKSKNAKTLYGYESAVCGKLEIYAIMWAMASRIIEFAAAGEWNAQRLEISGGCMDYSIRCMDYFRKSAMWVYGHISEGVKLNKTDCIRGLKDDILNQSMFAESIGVSQQYISKLLKQ